MANQATELGARDSFTRSERNGGDKTYLLLARRYIQWLEGAQVSLDGAGFPEAFAPAQRALSGLNALRRGDARQAQTICSRRRPRFPAITSWSQAAY